MDFESCITTLERVTHSPGLCTLPYVSSYECISRKLSYLLVQQAVPPKINRTIPPEDPARLESLDQIPEFLRQAVDDLIYHLDRSVMLRVRDIPHVP